MLATATKPTSASPAAIRATSETKLDASCHNASPSFADAGRRRLGELTMATIVARLCLPTTAATQYERRVQAVIADCPSRVPAYDRDPRSFVHYHSPSGQSSFAAAEPGRVSASPTMPMNANDVRGTARVAQRQSAGRPHDSHRSPNRVESAWSELKPGRLASKWLPPMRFGPERPNRHQVVRISAWQRQSCRRGRHPLQLLALLVKASQCSLP